MTASASNSCACPGQRPGSRPANIIQALCDISLVNTLILGRYTELALTGRTPRFASLFSSISQGYLISLSLGRSKRARLHRGDTQTCGVSGCQVPERRPDLFSARVDMMHQRFFVLGLLYLLGGECQSWRWWWRWYLPGRRCLCPLWHPG